MGDICENMNFVNCFAAPLQAVHLEVVPVAGKNQAVNLSAVIQPNNVNLSVYYWWIGDNLQVKSYNLCSGLPFDIR